MIISVVVSNFIQPRPTTMIQKYKHKDLSYHSNNCLARKMSKLNDIIAILDSVSPPHRLLTAYDDHYIPLYSLQAFQALDKPFHMGVGPWTTGSPQKRVCVSGENLLEDGLESSSAENKNICSCEAVLPLKHKSPFYCEPVYCIVYSV